MKNLILTVLLSVGMAGNALAIQKINDPALAIRCHTTAMQLNEAYKKQDSTVCQYLVSGNLFEAVGLAITHNKDSIASMSLTVEINLLNYANAMECKGTNEISTALIEAASIQKVLNTELA